MIDYLKMFAGKMQFAGMITDFYEELVENYRQNVSFDSYLNSRLVNSRRRGYPDMMVYETMIRRIREGKSFSETAEGFISTSDQALIRSGEFIGKLDEGLESAIIARRSIQMMREAAVRTLVMPVIWVSMCIFVTALFGLKILPAFKAIVPLESMGPVFRFMAMACLTVGTYPWIFSIGLLVGLVGLAWSLPNMTGPMRRFFDYLPVYSTYRRYSSALTLIGLSALLRANVTIQEAIDQLSIFANRYQQEHLAVMKANFARGLAPSRAIETGYIDTQIVDRLQRFEETGQFEFAIKRIGNESIESTVKVVKAKIAQSSLIIMLVAGGYIAGTAWDFVGIYTLVQSAARAQH